jgi:DNA-binding transcriptional ArsR family regulator
LLIVSRPEVVVTVLDETGLSPASPNVARLDRLTNWLLGAILFIPFLISFGALRGLAAANGVSYPALYPIMVDGGLIIFKAIALRASLRGERDGYAWSMAVAATVISVVLNVVHVPPTLPTLGLARFMAALPPLVILAAFIAVSRRVEESVRREGALATYEALQQAIGEKRQTLDRIVKEQRQTAADLTATVSQLTAQKETLASELDALRGEIKAAKLTPNDVNLAKLTPDTADLVDANAARLTQKEQAMRQLLAYLDAHPDATMTAAAGQIGRSRSTVSNYVSELTDAGLLHKNGQGWEVKGEG